jgi:hypothetical protein
MPYAPPGLKYHRALMMYQLQAHSQTGLFSASICGIPTIKEARAMPLPIEFPNPIDDGDELNAAFLNKLVNFLYGGESIPSGIYLATCYVDEAVATSGNDIEIMYDGLLPEAYGEQSPSALNDAWKHGAFLSEDTYTLIVRARISASSGILKIKIDAVEVAAFDLYDEFDEHHVDFSEMDISIASGWHSITGVVDSKNAASSGYDAGWLKLHLRGSNV